MGWWVGKGREQYDGFNHFLYTQPSQFLDHSTSQGNSFTPNCCIINAPQAYNRLHCDLVWLHTVSKNVCKSKPFLYEHGYILVIDMLQLIFANTVTLVYNHI